MFFFVLIKIEKEGIHILHCKLPYEKLCRCKYDYKKYWKLFVITASEKSVIYILILLKLGNIKL